MQIRDIHVSDAWREVAEATVAAGGPVMVVGGVDTGKSTFVRYLLSRFIAARGTAALLDGDVGMAIVGPPGLVGLTLVADADSLDERPAADRGWFIGSTTPDRLTPIIVGHVRLAALAASSGIPIVINAGGLVQGPLAKLLHTSIADAIEARTVIGLTAGDDIEHLLTPLSRRGVEVVRLAPSPRARPKTRTYRTHLRTERFARCFEDAETRDFDLDAYALEGTLVGSGRPLDDARRREVESGLDTVLIEGEEAGDGVALVVASAPHEERTTAVEAALGSSGLHVIEAAETTGLLVGLSATDGECLGLGLIDAWTGGGSLSLHTSLDESRLADVRRLQLGTVRLNRNGDEIGRWAHEKTLAPANPETLSEGAAGRT